MTHEKFVCEKFVCEKFMCEKFMYKKFGDLLFMFFGTLMLTLLLIAAIYTAQTVRLDVEGHPQQGQGLVQEVVQKHTDFAE